MSSESPEKPELPSTQERRRVDLKAELGSDAADEVDNTAKQAIVNPKAILKSSGKEDAQPSTKDVKKENADDVAVKANKGADRSPVPAATAKNGAKGNSEPEGNPTQPKTGQTGGQAGANEAKSSGSNQEHNSHPASPQTARESGDASHEPSKARTTADSVGAYSTVRGDPAHDEAGEELNGTEAKEVTDEFEDGTVDEMSLKPATENNAVLSAQRKPDLPEPPSSRQATSISSNLDIQNGQRSKSIAKDLADAEAAAESNTRNGINSKKQPPSVDIPADHAAFEEETLKSADKPAIPERPMSPPPATTPMQQIPQANIEAPNEPEEYKGLVYYDGVDSLGRPVVILNADALPRTASRKAAVNYLLQRLEPIVTQGPYVCVFLNTGEQSKRNRLPAGWLASCYRQMSYPFKKNIKQIILVRPSFTLNLMLTLMYPLISKKALVKIKKVEKLSGLEAATNGEVTLQHLGPRFSTVAARSIIASEGPGFAQSSAYQMPNL